MMSTTKAHPQDLIQETLTRLRTAVVARLQGLCRDPNPEAVHQARIAIRRLRVALRAMRPYLDAPRRRRLVSALRQFTTDLETARDADVRAEAVQALIANLALRDRLDANPLLDLVAQRRDAARRALKQRTRSPKWRSRLSRLQRDAREPLVLGSRADSLLLIRDALARRQRRLHRVLRHIGHKPRQLHRLRLRIKASRYLDEDFGSLLSSSPDRQIKALRQLQNRLGEYHDNWRLKKWLRKQAAAHPIAMRLRADLDAQQTRLHRAVTRLKKSARKISPR
jgi:triphosphatase